MTKYPTERDCNNQLSGSQRPKGTSEPSQEARPISQAGWRGPGRQHRRPQSTASTQRMGLGNTVPPYPVSCVSTQAANSRRGPQRSKAGCDTAVCLHFYFVILLLLLWFFKIISPLREDHQILTTSRKRKGWVLLSYRKTTKPVIHGSEH